MPASRAVLMIGENGKGTIEENEIFGNALTGVEIKTGASPDAAPQSN